MYSEEHRAACKASFHATPEKLPEGPGFTTPEKKSVDESLDSQDKEKSDVPEPEDLVARQMQEMSSFLLPGVSFC